MRRSASRLTRILRGFVEARNLNDEPRIRYAGDRRPPHGTRDLLARLLRRHRLALLDRAGATGARGTMGTMTKKRVNGFLRALRVRRVRRVARVALPCVAPRLSAERRRRTNRHVMLISIDGFAAFHLDNTSHRPAEPARAGRGRRRAAQRDGVSEHDASVAHDAHHRRDAAPARRRQQSRRRSPYRQAVSHHQPAAQGIGPGADAVRRRAARPAAARRRSSGRKPRTIRRSTTTSRRCSTTEERAESSAVSPALLSELRRAACRSTATTRSTTIRSGRALPIVALTQAAVHLLKTRRPALLALHLLVADKVQHDFGPDALPDRGGADHGRSLRRADPRSGRRGRTRRPDHDRRRRRSRLHDGSRGGQPGAGAA